MNKRDIKAIKWENDKEYSIGNCLFLRVRQYSKTFIIRKKHKGKRTIITLGKHPLMSLKDAKFQAMQFSQKQDISNITVLDLKEKYWLEVVEPNSKVPKQVIGYLKHIENEFGQRKVIDIARSMLVQFIQTYSKERGARSSDRIRSYLKQLGSGSNLFFKHKY